MVCSSAGTSASTVVGFTDRTGVFSTICASGGDDLLARGLLNLMPGLVGGRGERGVLRLMLGQPDDARMVLRASPLMAQSELLDPEHPGPELASRYSVAQPSPPHPTTIAW